MVPVDEDPKLESTPHAPDAEHASQATEASEATHDDERVDTPFDHPLFLPVVLLGLSLWFLWDGFIVPMEEHLLFNRGGFVVFAVATLWFGYKGIREMRALRDEPPDAREEGEA